MAEPRCLHCDQTRAQIKANQTICGTVSGYEYVELDEEWPRHHWNDWTNKRLARFGIRPEAFERHRRTQITQFQWAACDDTVQGHHYPKHSTPEYGFRINECMDCGHHRPTPSPETKESA